MLGQLGGDFLILDSISLDRIREDDIYNFQRIYEQYENEMDEDIDSPFNQYQASCEYYECNQFKQIFDNLLNSTSYIHFNCCSLSSHWEPFKEVLYNMQGEKLSFDFIGVTEIFKCDRDSRIYLPGFHDLISRHRKDCVRGGVGLFIKEHIHFKIREDLSVFIPHIFESVFVEIIQPNEAQTNNIIGIIYRPNTQPKADLDIFTSTLFDILDIINNEKKLCVLLGDLNIDLLKYNLHEKTNDFVDNMFAQGFIPLIHKPTRIKKSSASLIDHIYTNNLASNTISGIIATDDIADHYGIFHIIQNKSSLVKSPINHKRIFSKRNINSFKLYLEQIDFSSILQNNDPNDAYNQFQLIYKNAFNMHFPKKKYQSKQEIY